MGKKVKIINEDPILSKNFKYQKRKKTKLIQKAQSQEQKALQARRKRQLLEVEKKVDDQIQKITLNTIQMNRKLQLNRQKEKIFDNKSSNCSNYDNTYKSKTQQIILKDDKKETDFYQYHFQLKAKQNQIVKEKRINAKRKLQEATKKEIKGMFAAQHQESQQSQQIEEQDNKKKIQVYNLLLQVKKQTQIIIEKRNFHASSLCKNNISILSKPSMEFDDEDLNLSNTFIKGYFDHVFIENSQEQKIQKFRSIIIDHSIQHLQRSMSQQKGRGFTNCKILIITPFFGDAKAIFDLIQAKFENFQFKNKERLDELDDENDFFRIGIKIYKKKKSISYFSNFDHAQIIVASPIGLKSIIGSQGDQKRQNSFISSVQILYIDRASVLMMQNWSHLIEILKNINYMPRYESLKNSIDSIRESMLELKGRLYRQSIVFSQFNFPELNGLKFNFFHNIQGSITSKPFYSKPPVANDKVQLNFYKIQLKKAKDDLQARFDYFKRKFWDDLHNKQSKTKIVLFANSYFQYLKLKSFLQKVNASAQYICQHTSPNKIQSRVAKFNNQQFRILLLTQRAYYFDLCQIKKFHHIYFYSLPKNVFIFNDLLENIQENQFQTSNVVSIYTKYDILILQRLVGTIKAQEMAKQYCSNVSFVL